MSTTIADTSSSANAPQAASPGKRKRKTALHLLQYSIVGICILVVWQAVGSAGLIPPYALPTPLRVIQTAWRLLLDGSLPVDMGISFLRVLEGFAIAAGVGLAFGVLTGISDNFRMYTDLVVQIIRPIPPIAWIPIAILWFGIGETSKVFIIFLGAFFPIFINVIHGITQIDKKYVEVADIYEVPRKKFVTHVILPGALPSILTGLRLGLTNAWLCVVAAEMIAAEQGVGFLLMDGRQLSKPDEVILGMATIGVIGFFMDFALRKLEARAIRWK